MALASGGPQQWEPGEPLSEDDYALLVPLIRRARELGRTPVRREVENAAAVKRRFRTWGNACRAAGLPWVNYPAQRRLSEQARTAQADQPHTHPHGGPAAGRVSSRTGGVTDHGGEVSHETAVE